MDLTALTLFGRARFSVLAELLALERHETVHLRELARRTGLSPTAVQYELRTLLSTGLLLQEGTGARPVYRFNLAHPIAGELLAIVRKLDSSRRAPRLSDDGHWASKRPSQRADHASPRMARKSPFLADRRLATQLAVNLKKDVTYDY